MTDTFAMIGRYPANDGLPDIQLRKEEGPGWLAQNEIAERFGRSAFGISHKCAKPVVKECRDRFDEARSATEANANDVEAIRDIEEAEKQIAKKKEGGK